MKSSSWLFGLVSLCTLSIASASPVGPGQSIPSNNSFVQPTGDLIAQNSRDFTLTYDPNTNPGVFSPDPAQDYTGHFTLNTEFWRDPATKHLSFVYQVAGGASNGKSGTQEGGNFDIRSFGQFTTDVTASEFGTINRSADGATLSNAIPGQGIGQLPRMAVVTNATKFDSNGSISGQFTEEWGVLDLEGGSTTAFLNAPLSLDGTFQPTTSSGGGNAIPLPPAVWTGLTTLATIAGYGFVQKRATRKPA
jgi:hypothetical protein